MGTSGSYLGGGGKPGGDLRDEVGAWLDQLPSNPPSKNQPVDRATYRLPIRVATHAIGMFRKGIRSADGGGGSASGTSAQSGRGRASGAQRSVSRTARAAGRAAAAAYAYGTANRQILADLGLNYDELQALNDPLELSCRIVEAACGPRSKSTIDHEEQRWVAAEIAEWVFQEQEEGSLPQPVEIARKAIAFIISEAIASETGDLIHSGERPDWTTVLLEDELREAAEVLSQKAELSVDGVTNAEFAKVIEEGIETLHRIYGVMD